MTEAILVEFDGYDPKPREDGKYRFAISLGDLDATDPAELIAILTSPEATALEGAHLDFDYEARNGNGSLVGWRMATPEELAQLEKRRADSRRWQAKSDREHFERITKAHPDWLDEPKRERND